MLRASLFTLLTTAFAGEGTAQEPPQDSEACSSLLQIDLSVTAGRQASSRLVSRGVADLGKAAVVPPLPPPEVLDCDYLRDSAGAGPCAVTTTTAPTTTTTTALTTVSPRQQEGSTTGSPSSPLDPADSDFIRDADGIFRLIPMAVVKHVSRQLLESHQELHVARQHAHEAWVHILELLRSMEVEWGASQAASAKASGENQLAAASVAEAEMLRGKHRKMLGIHQQINSAMSRLNSSWSMQLNVSYVEGTPCEPSSSQGSSVGTNNSNVTQMMDVTSHEEDTLPSFNLLEDSDTGQRQPPASDEVGHIAEDKSRLLQPQAPPTRTLALGLGTQDKGADPVAMCEVNRTVLVPVREIPQLRDRLNQQRSALSSLQDAAVALENSLLRGLDQSTQSEQRALRRKAEQENQAQEHLRTLANLTKAFHAMQTVYEANDPWLVGEDGLEAINASLNKFYRTPIRYTNDPQTSISSSGGRRLYITLPVWVATVTCVVLLMLLAFVVGLALR